MPTNREVYDYLKNKAQQTVARVKPVVNKAATAVKERSVEIAHEMNESREQERREHSGRRKSHRRESYDPPMGGGMAIPHDPFGVGGFGGFVSAPRSAPPAKPRRKSRKKSNQPRNSGPDMFGIPSHMRHLF